MKPLIGITTYSAENILGGMRVATTMLPLAYEAAVLHAGGRVVLLPPGGDDIDAQYTVAMALDGLLLPGGPDLNPHLYGATENHPLTQSPDDPRDEWEGNLLVHALVNRVPVLGICRGMQLLNVQLGGSLHQHLMHAAPHENNGASGFGTHQVAVRMGSIVGKILGPEPVIDVPTRHHQAVARLGRGLDVSARHRDGTIEAIELPGDSFTVGVQWHPERGTDMRLFDAFIDAASEG